MATCLIGLGANQGRRAENLAAAVELLSNSPGLEVLQKSREFACPAAVGGAHQAEFLNAAVHIKTELAPEQVLTITQHIEEQLGRRHEERWGPRDIDLDLLLYDDWVLSDAKLSLPHPRMAFRRFVLEPAAEIAANLIHPTTGYTISELLARLDQPPRRIEVTGASSSQSRELARQAAFRCQASWNGASADTSLVDRLSVLLASPTRQTAIELADKQSNDLPLRSDPRVTGCPPTIRDSWFGEYFALAKLALAPDEFSKFNRHWQDRDQANPQLLRPTLIVISLVATPTEREARLQNEIKTVAMQQRQSPWLMLDGDDPAWAVREVVAAFEAMH